MHYGPIPEGMQIDHIDHDRTNNAIANLRMIVGKHNQKNMSKAINNTSGTTGVTWHKGNNKWIAKIQVNGKTINLGSPIILDEAIKLRKLAEITYGFHKNHGK